MLINSFFILQNQLITLDITCKSLNPILLVNQELNKYTWSSYLIKLRSHKNKKESFTKINMP